MAVRQRRRKREDVPQRRLWIERKMGFAPVLHCWCGATELLQEDDFEAYAAHLSAFSGTHEDCLPKEEGEQQ